MKPGPKFPERCHGNRWPAQLSDLQKPLALCCFFHSRFSSLQSFTYLSELIAVWHHLFYFFISPSTSLGRVSRNVAYNAVQCVILAGEECAEGALWFGSVSINSASVAFTQSLWPSSLQAHMFILGRTPVFSSSCSLSLCLPNSFCIFTRVLWAAVTGPQRRAMMGS